MSDKLSSRRGSLLFRFSAGVTAVAIAAVLYFLSLGPAEWLAYHEYISLRTYRTVYGPIVTLNDHSPAFSTILHAYVDLWRPDLTRRPKQQSGPTERHWQPTTDGQKSPVARITHMWSLPALPFG
jgi:hypothetical protein